jgi:hypothetical protein
MAQFPGTSPTHASFNAAFMAARPVENIHRQTVDENRGFINAADFHPQAPRFNTDVFQVSEPVGGCNRQETEEWWPQTASFGAPIPNADRRNVAIPDCEPAMTPCVSHTLPMPYTSLVGNAPRDDAATRGYVESTPANSMPSKPKNRRKARSLITLAWQAQQRQKNQEKQQQNQQQAVTIAPCARPAAKDNGQKQGGPQKFCTTCGSGAMPHFKFCPFCRASLGGGNNFDHAIIGA